jgi:hypothetical protein
MPSASSNSRETWLRRMLRGTKRTAIGALFSLILLIPRIRRLRRRVWAWAAIRILTTLVGCGIAWRSGFVEARAGYLFLAVVLLLFAAFLPAQPQVKTLDEKARELGALVALNGGRLMAADGIASCEEVHLFAGAERLLVVNHCDQILRNIPMSAVRNLAALPAGEPSPTPAEGAPWELVVEWDSEARQCARFHFEGFFAEHLARVAETTIENLRRKELPVLR